MRAKKRKPSDWRLEVGLREEPDREGAAQERDGARTPRTTTRPDKGKDRQTDETDRRTDKQTSTRARKQAQLSHTHVLRHTRMQAHTRIGLSSVTPNLRYPLHTHTHTRTHTHSAGRHRRVSIHFTQKVMQPSTKLAQTTMLGPCRRARSEFHPRRESGTINAMNMMIPAGPQSSSLVGFVLFCCA